MSKINTKETINNNKDNEAKTLQNIKYEPILSQLVLESWNLKNSLPWTKFDPLTTNIF